MTAAVSHGQHRDDCSCKPCATDLHDVHDLELVLEEDWVADGADVVQRVGLDRLDLQGGRDGGEQLVDGPARAGWVSVLLLEWLRNAVQPPGPTDSLSLSRVGQHPAIGMATERSAATRPNKRTHRSSSTMNFFSEWSVKYTLSMIGCSARSASISSSVGATSFGPAQAGPQNPMSAHRITQNTQAGVTQRSSG